jgi:hypothetical protein
MNSDAPPPQPEWVVWVTLPDGTTTSHGPYPGSRPGLALAAHHGPFTVPDGATVTVHRHNPPEQP